MRKEVRARAHLFAAEKVHIERSKLHETAPLWGGVALVIARMKQMSDRRVADAV